MTRYLLVVLFVGACTVDMQDADDESATETAALCGGGKTKICHATGSATQPFVLITVSNQALRAHRHHGDIIPAPPEGCPGDTPPPPVCTPGSTASCYDGPTGTEGVGTCTSGTMTCNADGSGYGDCDDAVTPVFEVCGDGIDNDCDGNTDNGCVGNRVWHDLNLNGVQNAGEPGFADIPLELKTVAGELVQSTTTDSNGIYYFTGVSPGTYFVEVLQVIAGSSPLLSLTFPNAGANDATDSDFPCSMQTCKTANFTVTTTAIDHIDAGYADFND